MDLIDDFINAMSNLRYYLEAILDNVILSNSHILMIS